jgi:hypothetical protein
MFPPKAPPVSVTPAGEPPPELVAALRQGRCILFTGEEFSRQCGCPTWTYLLLGIGEYLADSRRIDRGDGDKLRQIHREQRFAHLEKVIRTLLEEFPDALPEYLGKLYARPLMLPPPHEWLRKLPFAGLVTPTHDPVARRIMGGNERVTRLRGDIFWPKDAEKAGRELCRQAVGSRAVLFVGTSAEEIDRWFTADPGSGPHLALIPNGQPSPRAVRTLSYSAATSVQLVDFLKKLDVAAREDQSEPANTPGG